MKLALLQLTLLIATLALTSARPTFDKIAEILLDLVDDRPQRHHSSPYAYPASSYGGDYEYGGHHHEYQYGGGGYSNNGYADRYPPAFDRRPTSNVQPTANYYPSTNIGPSSGSYRPRSGYQSPPYEGVQYGRPQYGEPQYGGPPHAVSASAAYGYHQQPAPYPAQGYQTHGY